MSAHESPASLQFITDLNGTLLPKQLLMVEQIRRHRWATFSTQGADHQVLGANFLSKFHSANCPTTDLGDLLQSSPQMSITMLDVSYATALC